MTENARWRVEATIAEDGTWESPHTWFAYLPGRSGQTGDEFPTWADAYAYADAMARAGR